MRPACRPGCPFNRWEPPQHCRRHLMEPSVLASLLVDQHNVREEGQEHLTIQAFRAGRQFGWLRLHPDAVEVRVNLGHKSLGELADRAGLGKNKAEWVASLKRLLGAAGQGAVLYSEASDGVLYVSTVNEDGLKVGLDRVQAWGKLDALAVYLTCYHPDEEASMDAAGDRAAAWPKPELAHLLHLFL